MTESIQDAESMVYVRGEMTIYRAHELLQEFTAAVRDCPDGSDIIVDLSKVTEFDTAGLQIILMARRMALAAGERFRVIDPSECVMDVLTLCNVSDVVGAPSVAVAPDVETKR